MKKKLLCLFLVLIMVLSVALTACSNEDEEAADVDEETGAQTITMRLVTEKKVCNTDEELADYLENECGGDKESQKYLDMLAVKADYDRVEAAFTKITKSKYKVNVDLLFYTEEEYSDMLKVTMEQYAVESKNAELAARALSKYISDYKAAYPDANYPDKRLAIEFYKFFPEYEKYMDLSVYDDEDEEDDTPVFEEQYQENELGIQELVYPATEDSQLDIIYISGREMYNEYVENEWIAALDEYMSTTGKKLGDYITGALLNGVKVDGSTYAIPNNIKIGEYTYMLVNKELFDKYYHNKDAVSNVLDLKYFLDDIKTNETDIAPLAATFKDCIDQFVWYWNIDSTRDSVTKQYSYAINYSNNFSLVGALYGDPQTAGRGLIELGCNNLFLNEEYRNIFLGLKEYEFNGYYAEEGADVENAAVSFVTGDYSIKAQTLENDGVCTVDGTEYYAYVIKYPEADEASLYGNMYAISANSKHTLACMQVLTLLNTNSELRNILQYGILGEDYIINDDTKQLERLNTNYLMKIERTGNCFIAHPEEGNSVDYWENAKKQNNDALINPLLGFDFNEQLKEYDANLDNNLLKYTAELSRQTLEKIEACGDYEELVELVNDKTTGLCKTLEGNPLMYIEGIADAFPLNLIKYTNKLYDTASGGGTDSDGEPIADKSGESPYAVYYSWMQTYGFVPAGK